jgi:two-component system, NtrC family, sensor kinase
VFDAIVGNAAKLREAEFSTVARFDKGLLHLEAINNMSPEETTAFHSLFPHPPGRGFVMGRAFVDGRPAHLRDVLAERDYDVETRDVLQSVAGYRSFLGVPILGEGRPIGVIGCGRREVKPIEAAQIELLQTFANQAAIAMESARLFQELRGRTDELAQHQAELRVILENMGDGVAMFDEVLRLVARNRRFQDILDVPNGLLAERPTFDGYVGYLTERGDSDRTLIGPPNSAALPKTPAHSYERMRPKGKVIEVRHNPVPSGGFVLIYADITERKRNEAAIIAARDAAEEVSRTIDAAYRELKAAQANLIQAEKMASLGQVTAGIAHEIKNPLNFVNNFASLSVELLGELKSVAATAPGALDDDRRAEIDEVVGVLTSNLEKITENGRRADGIVRSMLEHSRGGPMGVGASTSTRLSRRRSTSPIMGPRPGSELRH